MVELKSFILGAAAGMLLSLYFVKFADRVVQSNWKARRYFVKQAIEDRESDDKGDYQAGRKWGSRVM